MDTLTLLQPNPLCLYRTNNGLASEGGGSDVPDDDDTGEPNEYDDDC